MRKLSFLQQQISSTHTVHFSALSIPTQNDSALFSTALSHFDYVFFKMLPQNPAPTTIFLLTLINTYLINLKTPFYTFLGLWKA